METTEMKRVRNLAKWANRLFFFILAIRVVVALATGHWSRVGNDIDFALVAISLSCWYIIGKPSSIFGHNNEVK